MHVSGPRSVIGVTLEAVGERLNKLDSYGVCSEPVRDAPPARWDLTAAQLLMAVVVRRQC